MAWTNVPGSDAMEWQPDAASYGGLLGGLSGQDKTLALGLLGLGMLGGNYGRNKREAMANAFQGGMQGGLTGLNMATQAAAQQRRLGQADQELGLRERSVRNQEDTSVLQRQMLEEQIRQRKAYDGAMQSLLPFLTGNGQPQAPQIPPQAAIPAGGNTFMQTLPMPESAMAPPVRQAPTIDPRLAPILPLALAKGPEGVGSIIELAKASKPDKVEWQDAGDRLIGRDPITGQIIPGLVQKKEQTPGEADNAAWRAFEWANPSVAQRHSMGVADRAQQRADVDTFFRTGVMPGGGAPSAPAPSAPVAGPVVPPPPQPAAPMSRNGMTPEGRADVAKQGGINDAKFLAGLRDARFSAEKTLPVIDRMQRFTLDDKTFSNAGAEFRVLGGNIANLLGVQAPRTSNSEQYIADLGELTRGKLSAYGSGTGVSNLDLLAAQKTLPELSKTPQGRQQILAAMKQDLSRIIEYHKQADPYFQQNSNLSGFQFRDPFATQSGLPNTASGQPARTRQEILDQYLKGR